MKKKNRRPLRPEVLYQNIREQAILDGDEPTIGDHWHGIGCYIGEDIWGDPEAFGGFSHYAEFDYPRLMAEWMWSPDGPKILDYNGNEVDEQGNIIDDGT